jgi:dinuclear metal center YbgI/SA1388 family protein
MVERQTLLTYLDNFLAVPTYKDYAPNGLQVEGKNTINTIVSGVTASQALLEKAIQQQADLLLVHHGYFWKGESPVITGMKKKRIELLLKHGINLTAYHLPLDCHQSLGNNAKLAEVFSVSDITSHEIMGCPNILWQGNLKKPLSSDAFLAFCQKHLSKNTLHLPSASNRDIKSIAWCSGGAQDYLEHAANLGVDAYISGEVSERTTHQALELDTHYFACGHHATERLGVKALGEHLAREFDLHHCFIDIPNPV